LQALQGIRRLAIKLRPLSKQAGLFNLTLRRAKPRELVNRRLRKLRLLPGKLSKKSATL
jgi:hypothetical protein